MSDYLHNLINRIHPPQDAIRPRLAARFESASGIGDTLNQAGGPTAVYPTDIDEGDRQRVTPASEAPVAYDERTDNTSRPPVIVETGAQRRPAVGPMNEPESLAPSHRVRVQPATPTTIPQDATSNIEAHFQQIRRTVSPQAPSLPMLLATEPAAPVVGQHDEKVAMLPRRAPIEADRPIPIELPRWQVQSHMQPLGHGEEPTMATLGPGECTATSSTATSATTPLQPRPVTSLPLADPLSTPGPALGTSSAGPAPSAVVGAAGAQMPVPITPSVRAATPITPWLPEPPPPIDTRLENRQSGPPVIRVTIGRIEVRATPARPESARRQPAPTTRQPLPQPALSLDAYLKQRGGSR